MQGFPKKRRKPGPSKNEEKIRRNEAAERRGSIPLSAAFPSLEHISGRLAFTLPPGGTLLEEKTIEASANQPVELSFDCPGRCGGGKFHLSPKLTKAVVERRERLDVAETCAERAMGTGPCGCELRGTLTLRLTPLPE